MRFDQHARRVQRGHAVDIFASGGTSRDAVLEVEEDMQAGGQCQRKKGLILRFAVEMSDLATISSSTFHPLGGQRTFVFGRAVGG
jgi:hypothetical protein